MARFKVDKKLFDERVLQEQLKQIELQGKYLKDEPLKRSEVDEYNKLQANGWVKNILISLGVIFSTVVAIIIFVLLGNMLITNGRTGQVGKISLDSAAIYEEFKNSREVDPEHSDYPENGKIDGELKIIEHKVPNDTLINDTLISFGVKGIDRVTITYRLKWIQKYDSVTWLPVIINGENQGYWEVGRDPVTKTIGFLTQDLNTNNSDYQLDEKTVDLNTLMTNWFKGQEDGWAKTMIERWFYTAWPLTFVFWLVFILAIAGYGVVLVVGIRYVIRTIIVVLRRGGYIASDFVKEVVDTVVSEIPIVETEKVEEIDFTTMKNQLEKKLKEDKANFEPIGETEKPEVMVQQKPEKKVVVKPEPVEEPKETKEPEVTKKLESEKSGTDKVKDIFNM